MRWVTHKQLMTYKNKKDQHRSCHTAKRKMLNKWLKTKRNLYWSIILSLCYNCFDCTTFSEIFIRLGLYFFLQLQNIMELVSDTFRERRFAENQSANFTCTEFTLSMRALISLCSKNTLVSSANNNSCNNLETFVISFI